MPTLVHLADERDTQKILNGGIKTGRYRAGIYCMPVLPNFYVTHQWLRELKNGGVKTFVGVYFKVDSSEMVYAGRYDQRHKRITLGQAIKEIMSLEDPLGYELIIDRKIEPNEISKVRNLPQTIGWRYRPGSNGTKPCACEYCIRRNIKANRIRERYGLTEKRDNYLTLINKIRQSEDGEEVVDLLYKIQSKKRRSDPEELSFLLDKFTAHVHVVLAKTLSYFKHQNTERLLVKLLSHSDADVREYSAISLLKTKGDNGLKLLQGFTYDPVIQKVIEEQENQDQYA